MTRPATRTARNSYRHRGVVILRGEYADTMDNRLDGWYVQSPSSAGAGLVDRRGPGCATLAEARAVVDEMLDSATVCVCPGEDHDPGCPDAQTDTLRAHAT